MSRIDHRRDADRRGLVRVVGMANADPVPPPPPPGPKTTIEGDGTYAVGKRHRPGDL